MSNIQGYTRYLLREVIRYRNFISSFATVKNGELESSLKDVLDNAIANYYSYYNSYLNALQREFRF